MHTVPGSDIGNSAVHRCHACGREIFMTVGVVANAVVGVLIILSRRINGCHFREGNAVRREGTHEIALIAIVGIRVSEQKIAVVRVRCLGIADYRATVDPVFLIKTANGGNDNVSRKKIRYLRSLCQKQTAHLGPFSGNGGFIIESEAVYRRIIKKRCIELE